METHVSKMPYFISLVPSSLWVTVIRFTSIFNNILISAYDCPGLVSQPGHKSLSLGIVGYDQTASQWKIIDVNFTKIISRQCE